MLHNAVALPTFAGRATIYAEGRVAKKYLFQRAPLFSDKNAAFIPGLPALGFLQLGFRVQPFIENKFHIV